MLPSHSPQQTNETNEMNEIDEMNEMNEMNQTNEMNEIDEINPFPLDLKKKGLRLDDFFDSFGLIKLKT